MRRVGVVLLVSACAPEGDEPSPTGGAGEGYVLGSVVITPDGRTTYFQVIPDLAPAAPIDNSAAVEASGNGVLLTHGRDVFLGLAESPEWVRYTVAADGGLAETGRMSLAPAGFSYVDYGNVIVADDLAVSVGSESQVAVIWDPSTMTLRDTIELPHLHREGYSVEVWTTVAKDGLVYIPARWSDWEGGRIYPQVSTTVLDPRSGQIVAVAEDDRCASGGRVVFTEAGDGYVMGDGRSYSAHMFANAGGDPAPPNCILRLPAGGTDFASDYHVEASALTGGLETVTELETPAQGTSAAYAWVFDPARLPEGVEPVDFGFWSYPAFQLWQFELGDAPTAAPVDGVPYGVLGFTGSSVDGRLYYGLGDTETSVVYEIDPETGSATEKFTMDGYLYGLAKLAP